MDDLLKEYAELSKVALKELDKEEFENLEVLLEQRAVLLKEIVKLNDGNAEIKELIKKYEVLEIERDFVEKLKNKKEKVRENLNNIRKMKAMNSQYRDAAGKVFFLNKQI
ncbi:hypothetical protein [Clostridium massiliamazoniense]|uniref:hypothetical protein n=1 Tax=Clostridium massiliamazoniense TaxID=1347366 RepID=UPI0006D7D8B6|nr:hypothetical protein [Clostridium massiliamazoniense]